MSQGSVNFKFGILYAKDGQLTDDEMFSNGEFFTFFLIVLFIQIKKVGWWTVVLLDFHVRVGWKIVA